MVESTPTDLVPAELSELAALHARLLTNPYNPDGKRRIEAKMTTAKKQRFCDAIANGVTPTNAAKALGVSERLLWSLTNRNEIPHFKLGRATLYSVDALRQWMAEKAKAEP